ncbi:MAG: tRNA (adenosine(37)-N6)-threonylcarbamoyltransferase complex dimerization subunit type 1 TsaB [Syntrophomonadaceae bacterium]|nr:tRNA (adenosine(37)-N6)-threonylcarbamoyltransferase complex dimerization subunit type 1 TsaB [Syntrophomonadaceae bacterium]MDD3889425.1 tRNA (adenosine(37)-N6)-threonylcarbamoyltransferase complex dimerization subunit type 1 TsaB [Syntrophomonadaceae bacterium]MDD4548395.1 tRNA (adenosine(37)-N6)-threonylcarbamoyltransferase complex dimerization subunit type 1 TsaB [Syntrophomonadaceae bacterium]
MLVLAVDSATPVAGVALVNDEKVIREDFVNYKKTHSETLMPMIDKVLKECDCCLDDIDAIAVTIGPGSFTGLRIGMATVKGLCLASGKPLVGISTLEVLAHNITGSDAMVCPLLDARKQEVYCGFFNVSSGLPQEIAATTACSPQEFAAAALDLARQNDIDRFILLGDGYYAYKDYFQQEFGQKLIKVPSHLLLPRAAAAGSLGIIKASQGDFKDIFQLRPVYLRLSEAEYRLGRGEL